MSVTLLNTLPNNRPETVQIVRWLRSLTPVDRTRTMFIYRFEGGE